MRHSLLLRLLGLSLAVAVFAIAATAWLINRDASERFRGEFERTLEADTFIFQELNAYATRHDSWDGVEALVADLAERTDRRVALTTLEGEVLADSAAIAGHPAPALSSNPTAEIDALSDQLRGLETTVVGYQGDSFVAENLDTTVMEKWEASAATRSAAGQVLVSSFAPSGISPVWRLETEEAQARVSLAVEAQNCLRDELGTEDELVVTPTGEVMIVGEAYAERLLDGVAIPDDYSGDLIYGLNSMYVGGGEAAHPCLSGGLFEASEAALKFNEQEIRSFKECLEGNDIPYVVVEVEAGLKRVVPEPGTDGSTSSLDEPGWGHWGECEQSAWTETMEDFVAEPALLYSGDAGRFDPFFGDGWWRTVLAGAAVLIAATGVTVLAGRRLARPIRALTAAAGRMGAGEHGVRVAAAGRDEVSQLASAFNAMAESLETNETQRRAMVSDVAHELRTPLANVRGYLEAAQDGVVPLDSGLVTSLLEESALLQRLIDDLQDLALADAGKLRIHPEPRDAVDLVRQSVAAHRASADDAGVVLVADLDADGDDAPASTIVSVDPGRLRQALGNLVSNAIRFTPECGTVTVSVRSDGESVALSVADDGPGIPSEHLPRLFDRFYRVEESRSRETGGSGLGLAITKHLVEAHLGSVDVSSAEGEGSVFTIRLPAVVPTPAD
ncbi:HAMP domain-containing protein [Phytoactinopolyspora alkaliphila]|uniref:histidine kinase n=1 Tax=Phytoactinopolyspora alkaliphila TaxID=1783498 RepID=A0A6N9YJZ4_9ACTN|nr:ATP-binding protein [Phytoactinopolyspora alkaliphila]NED95381.1 HAMP domain-containing protein [Phytoactinopolyspora alkaliphila]